MGGFTPSATDNVIVAGPGPTAVSRMIPGVVTDAVTTVGVSELAAGVSGSPSGSLATYGTSSVSPTASVWAAIAPTNGARLGCPTVTWNVVLITPPLLSLAVTVTFAVPIPMPVNLTVAGSRTVAITMPTSSDSASRLSVSPSGSDADTATSMACPTSTCWARMGLITGAWFCPFTVTMNAVLVKPPWLSLAVTVIVAAPDVTPVTRICAAPLT